MLLSLLVFLVLLSVLVLIHELGHFIVARKLGIKVEEFGFGFPPKLWSFKKGETEYSINWLPIGGFVKLYGEDEAGGGKVSLPTKNQELRIASNAAAAKKDEERAFYSKTPWQRAAVVVAGVVMNAGLAVIIFYAYLALSGFTVELPHYVDHTFLLADQQVKGNEIIIDDVSPNSPASNAGITKCSKTSCLKITAINNKIIRSTEQFIDLIATNVGKQTMFSLEDKITQKKLVKEITPRVNPPKGQGALGIAYNPMSDFIEVSYKTPIQKLFSGIVYPIDIEIFQLKALGRLFSIAVKEKTIAPISDTVSGPVGIFNFVGKLLAIPDIKEKLLQVINLAGLLSISLAFFNILPIPALDGGRLFFILIEAISGKKVNQRFESITHTVGMIVLLGLLLFITINDVQKMFFTALPPLKP